MINRMTIEKVRNDFRTNRRAISSGLKPNMIPAGDLTPKSMLESMIRFAKDRVSLVVACKTVNDLRRLGHEELSDNNLNI